MSSSEFSEPLSEDVQDRNSSINLDFSQPILKNGSIQDVTEELLLEDIELSKLYGTSENLLSISSLSPKDGVSKMGSSEFSEQLSDNVQNTNSSISLNLTQPILKNSSIENTTELLEDIDLSKLCGTSDDLLSISSLSLKDGVSKPISVLPYMSTPKTSSVKVMDSLYDELVDYINDVAFRNQISFSDYEDKKNTSAIINNDKKELVDASEPKNDSDEKNSLDAYITNLLSDDDKCEISVNKSSEEMNPPTTNGTFISTKIEDHYSTFTTVVENEDLQNQNETFVKNKTKLNSTYDKLNFLPKGFNSTFHKVDLPSDNLNSTFKKEESDEPSMTSPVPDGVTKEKKLDETFEKVGNGSFIVQGITTNLMDMDRGSLKKVLRRSKDMPQNTPTTHRRHSFKQQSKPPRLLKRLSIPTDASKEKEVENDSQNAAGETSPEFTSPNSNKREILSNLCNKGPLCTFRKSVKPNSSSQPGRSGPLKAMLTLKDLDRNSSSENSSETYPVRAVSTPILDKGASKDFEQAISTQTLESRPSIPSFGSLSTIDSDKHNSCTQSDGTPEVFRSCTFENKVTSTPAMLDPFRKVRCNFHLEGNDIPTPILAPPHSIRKICARNNQTLKGTLPTSKDMLPNVAQNSHSSKTDGTNSSYDKSKEKEEPIQTENHKADENGSSPHSNSQLPVSDSNDLPAKGPPSDGTCIVAEIKSSPIQKNSAKAATNVNAKRGDSLKENLPPKKITQKNHRTSLSLNNLKKPSTTNCKKTPDVQRPERRSSDKPSPLRTKKTEIQARGVPLRRASNVMPKLPLGRQSTTTAANPPSKSLKPASSQNQERRISSSHLTRKQSSVNENGKKISTNAASAPQMTTKLKPTSVYPNVKKNNFKVPPIGSNSKPSIGSNSKPSIGSTSKLQPKAISSANVTKNLSGQNLANSASKNVNTQPLKAATRKIPVKTGIPRRKD